jgi:hypothetical protein
MIVGEAEEGTRPNRGKEGWGGDEMCINRFECDMC